MEERNNINGRVRKKELMTLMLFLANEELLSEKEKDELIKYILSLRDMDESGYDDIMEQLRMFKLQ